MHQPHKYSQLAAAATAVAISAASLDPNITSRYIPKRWIEIDISDKENEAVAALRKRLFDENGHGWALGEGEQATELYEFDPQMILISCGTFASHDKDVLLKSGGNPSITKDTTVEIYGTYCGDPATEPFPASEMTQALRDGQAISWAAQWQFASGEKSNQDKAFEDKRQRIDLYPNAGVPRPRPGRDDQEVDQLDPRQNRMKSGVLDLLLNMMYGQVPDNEKEATADFFKDFTVHIRDSRGVQDQRDTGTEEAPAVADNQPVAAIAAAKAAEHGQVTAPEAELDEALQS